MKYHQMIGGNRTMNCGYCGRRLITSNDEEKGSISNCECYKYEYSLFNNTNERITDTSETIEVIKKEFLENI